MNPLKSEEVWESDTLGMMKGIAIHHELMRAQITAHNGYEVKTEGDAFMVAFQNPEDAIEWCLTTQELLLKILALQLLSWMKTHKYKIILDK